MTHAAPALAALLLSATAAAADLNIAFREGAPKDRFVFQNSSDCALTGATLSLDLSGSEAGLIFDVTAAGAGVEVFQPLELVEGHAALAALPEVRDGDTRIDLPIASLPPGQSIAFTIDVDDTIGQREITVSGSEIEGARIIYSAGGKAWQTSFNTAARARIPIEGC